MISSKRKAKIFESVFILKGLVFFTSFCGESCVDGLNRYTYCHNNPIKYNDPTGHVKKKASTGKGSYSNKESNSGNSQNGSKKGSRSAGDRRGESKYSRDDNSDAKPSSSSNGGKKNKPSGELNGTGKTEYLGVNIVVPNPIALLMNLGKPEHKQDPTNFTISAGLYVGKTDGEDVSLLTSILFGGETGLYGTVGAGKGSPNVSASIEYGNSPNSSPDVVLSGESVESGMNVGVVEVSAFGSEGQFRGMEVSIGASIIPVDVQSFVEKSGHIRLFY